MQNGSARNDRREMPPREMAQREMARTARIISLARKNCALARIKSRPAQIFAQIFALGVVYIHASADGNAIRKIRAAQNRAVPFSMASLA